MKKAFESVDLDNLDNHFKAVLEDVEDLLGEELIVTSGYRSPDHPVEAKKSKPGEHAEGQAVDVAAVGGPKVLEIVTAAIAAGITRIGINRHKNFIHLGGSKLRTKSIWTYDK